MATARYVGAENTAPFDFSSALRTRLSELFEKFTKEQESVFEAADIEFTNHVLIEARWGLVEYRALQQRLSKKEIVGEINDIGSLLTEAQEKLAKLSPQVDGLIIDSEHPLELSDSIEKFVAHITAAKKNASSLRVSSTASAEKKILLELAVRVLRVLAEYGISASQTQGESIHSSSPAIQILYAIARDIGLRRSAKTWRGIVGEVKQIAPELKAQ